MTYGFIDPSCLVAVAVAEPGSEALADRLERMDRFFASKLLDAELRAVLRREGVRDDGTLMAGLSWVLPDRPLTAEIQVVLDTGKTRGAAAWHLACALYLSRQPRELES